MTTRPLLEVVELCKQFESGGTVVRAVDGVSFATERGQITMVMGPSGSGKTTLLTMIGALLRPTSGQVIIDGCDIAAVESRRLPAIHRHSIGFVFQTFNLLDALTAQENVELALNVNGISGAAAAERARELLVTGGLERRAHPRPGSFGRRETARIDRPGHCEPPTTAPGRRADSQSRLAHGQAVMELLIDLARAQHTAVVVVSHDTRREHLADQMLWLEDGRWCEPALQPPDVR